MEETFKKIKSLLVGGALLFVIFGILPATAQAATLYFSPSSGSHAVGTTLSVSIYVSSADQAMNAASGVIAFPQDKLEVTSLSKSGSIFSLWVQEPSFSNTAGTINFEGIVLNPGFTGSNGKAITITFRTKAAGNAPLTFSSGSALANDGKGTNILTGLGDAAFSLGGATPTTVPEATTPGEAGTPGAPAISSPTHPDPNKWYSSSNPRFTWSIPGGITTVRLLYDKFPTTRPTVTYSSPIEEKALENIDDGVWYFHARFKNSAGWGEVSHFRFQIDTEKPDRFDIREVIRSDPTEPKAKFVFDANDKTSGIDHYEVQVDNESSQVWWDNSGHVYETPVLASGKHTLIVKAIDKAGNSLANSAEFRIEPLPPPTITEYPKELQTGETLAIKGITKYPDAQVIIWLQREKEDARSYTVRSDERGEFMFAGEEKLKEGSYKMWAEVVDERGAKSDPTGKFTIGVALPSILRIGSYSINVLSVVVPLIALIILLLLITWYGWHKFASFRKKLNNLRKEVREAESALHKAFDMLKEDIRDQVKLLEKTRTKRQLTEEEEKIIKQLMRDLDDAEKFVRKEIEDIEKEVK